MEYRHVALAIIRHLQDFRDWFSWSRLWLRSFKPVESQAMVLLLIFMSAGSILMGNLLQSYLNSDANMDERTWVFEHYGTAYRWCSVGPLEGFFICFLGPGLVAQMWLDEAAFNLKAAAVSQLFATISCLVLWAPKAGTQCMSCSLQKDLEVSIGSTPSTVQNPWMELITLKWRKWNW